MRLTSPTNVRYISTSSGIDGARLTLRYMARLATAGKKHLHVRLTAGSLLGPINRGNSKNWMSEIKILHRFVRDRIRYVRDVHKVEVLQSPDKTLELGYGDCDDKSILLASLLLSVGHPVRFVAVGFKPEKVSHVFVETKLGDRWIALETTENVPVGWRPKNVVHRIVVNVS